MNSNEPQGEQIISAIRNYRPDCDFSFDMTTISQQANRHNRRITALRLAVAAVLFASFFAGAAIISHHTSSDRPGSNNFAPGLAPLCQSPVTFALGSTTADSPVVVTVDVTVSRAAAVQELNIYLGTSSATSESGPADVSPNSILLPQNQVAKASIAPNSVGTSGTLNVSFGAVPAGSYPVFVDVGYHDLSGCNGDNGQTLQYDLDELGSVTVA